MRAPPPDALPTDAPPPAASLLDTIDALIGLSFAGERARFEDSVFELGQQLLSVPPTIEVSRAQVVLLQNRLSEIPVPEAAEAIGCCATIAAWHVGDRALLEAVARRWYRHLDVLVATLNPRWDGLALMERAGSAMQIGALCDVLFVEPSSVAGAIEASAAATRLQPRQELETAQRLIEDASYCEAARLLPGRWQEPLRSAAFALAGAGAYGANRQPRAATAALLRAFELLHEDAFAQMARISLLQGAIGEGLLPEADRVLKDAADGPLVLPDQRETLDLARAGILFRKGQPAEALRILDEVERRLVPGAWQFIHCTALRGEVAVLEGDDAGAVERLTPLLALLPAGPVAPPVLDLFAAPLERLALLALRLGNAPLAEETWQRLVASGAARRLNLNANRVEAALEVAAGRPDQARTILHRHLDSLESAAMAAEDQIGADPFLDNIAVLSADLAALEVDAGNGRAALLAAERARGWLFRSARAARPPEPASTGQLGLLEKIVAAEPGRDPDPQAVALDRFRRELVRRASEIPLRALLAARPLGSGDGIQQLESICAGLGAEWAFASIAVLETRLVAAFTDGHTVTTATAPLGFGRLLREATSLFTWVGRGRGPEPRSGRWRARSQAVLEELYNGLAAPLLAAMNRLGRSAVLLSAPGPIASLPLLALRPPGGVPLVEQLTGMAVVPGMAPAVDIASSLVPTDPVVVALAAPDIRAPLTSVEARFVAAAWAAEGATVLLDPAVDQVALLDGARAAGVLHVAAHGEWRPTAIAQSSLILRDEQAVDLGEIYSGLDLAGTDLVVLSACQTATSSFASSGEALSLATFALLAGARSVIASLWDVDDAASALLMTELHIRIAKGSDPATALIQCQRQLRAMAAGDAVARLTELEKSADDQREFDALAAASRQVVASGPEPFGSFDRWAPFRFHGMPGAPRIPRRRPQTPADAGNIGATASMDSGERA